MNDNLSETQDLKESLLLKLPEPEIQEDYPWADDALKRSDVAEKLTKLISRQSDPFVISLHGHWGTGKTFLLKRWQKQLEKDGFRAIYFNAWEDDFCDDPFVAIIGQLSDFLKRKGIEGLDDKIKKAAKSLLIQGSLSALHKVSGLNLDEVLEQFADKTLAEYSRQTEKKSELKTALQELSGKVKADTGHPLVFIIDELDRCRPTFAIELLERIKHIFDIPDMVFVFGINRDELCLSIRSVYGEIDSETYLRRFFDMEFSLPEIDSKVFYEYLIKRYQLEEFYIRMSQSTRLKEYTYGIQRFSKHLPVLCGHFGLSLRDIDYCIRLIVFTGKTGITTNLVSQPLLSLLILLRLKNKTLYQEYIRGNRTGSEVMNYIDELVPPENRDTESVRMFNIFEINLYIVDRKNTENKSKSIDALERLSENLQNGLQTTQTHYLSKSTQKSDIERIRNLLSILPRYHQSGIDPVDFSNDTITHLSELIELSQTFMRA